MLSIRVTAVGGVEDVKVVKTEGIGGEVAECVAAAARAASFPCNPGGLVNVPFAFEVSKSATAPQTGSRTDAGP